MCQCASTSEGANGEGVRAFPQQRGGRLIEAALSKPNQRTLVTKVREDPGQLEFFRDSALLQYRIRCMARLNFAVDGEVAFACRAPPNFVIALPLTVERTSRSG